MSKFTKFMKKNKKKRENEFYAVTRSLCDENEEPLKWEFKHISSKENDSLRDSCTTEVPIAGKPNAYRLKTNYSRYLLKMAAASIVSPDLYDKELQDSYGVTTPEDLLYAMVDDPGEYSDLLAYVQRFQGFNVSLTDKVEEAKN